MRVVTYDEIESLNRRRWGKAIASARTKAGWNQSEFGLMFDPPVSQSTVARWETGAAEPRIKHRLEIARLFGTDASLLFPYVDVAA